LQTFQHEFLNFGILADGHLELLFSLNSMYFLNLNPIKAKLTLLSYIHASKSLVYVHHYYSNNSYGDVRFFNY